MPIINDYKYDPPVWLRNGHVNTIYANAIRKKETPNYRRTIIRTADDDFVMIDRLARGSKKLVVICHGLEGSSLSNYVKTLAPTLYRNGFDVLCINFRSCGGVINRRLQMYHSGDTSDLHMVIKYHQDAYDTIDLVGFSLGGNVVLKYLGEHPEKVHHKIRRGVGISVPVDLAGGAQRLTEWDNVAYTGMFKNSLIKKIKKKHRQYPDQVDLKKINKVRTVIDFDEYFTAPIHGFDDAEDYYRKSSSKQFLPQIAKPTLLINAKDDPFLSEGCFPVEEAKRSDFLHLYTPDFGGHVGFADSKGETHYEEVVLEFLRDVAAAN